MAGLASSLADAQKSVFAVGNSVFNLNWVAAPAPLLRATASARASTRAPAPRATCTTGGVLPRWQERMLAQEPELIRQFAQRVAAVLRRAGHAGVEVRADAFLALNGRSNQRLLRADVDLAGVLSPDWILPAPPH